MDAGLSAQLRSEFTGGNAQLLVCRRLANEIMEEYYMPSTTTFIDKVQEVQHGPLHPLTRGCVSRGENVATQLDILERTYVNTMVAINMDAVIPVLAQMLQWMKMLHDVEYYFENLFAAEVEDESESTARDVFAWVHAERARKSRRRILELSIVIRDEVNGEDPVLT